MTPRLDPALPIVWRSPSSLQVGGARPLVVLEDPGPLEQGLLRALVAGASRRTLHTIGAALDGDPASVDALLDRLAPALQREAGSGDRHAAPGHGGTVVLAGPVDLVDDLGTALLRLGHHPTPVASADRAATDAAVLIGSRVVPPSMHLPWLAADVPHLAVVLDERGVEVGPFVRPGSGPCLRCTHLARRDADAAWPALAAQLAIAPPPPLRPRARHDALVLAASAVDDLLRSGATALDDASVVVSGEPRPAPPTPTPLDVHPDCGCRAPAGTATAPVHLDARRSAPSSATADAVPA